MCITSLHFAICGADTILERSATPAPNIGAATERSEAAKCVLCDVVKNFTFHHISDFFVLQLTPALKDILYIHIYRHQAFFENLCLFSQL